MKTSEYQVCYESPSGIPYKQKRQDVTQAAKIYQELYRINLTKSAGDEPCRNLRLEKVSPDGKVTTVLKNYKRLDAE